MAQTIKAAQFIEPGRIILDDKPVSNIGPKTLSKAIGLI